MKISEAEIATGKSRTTLLRAIKNGRISAVKDESGAWDIDAAELARVYDLKISDELGGVQSAHVRTPVRGAPRTGQMHRVDTPMHTPSSDLSDAHMWRGRYEEAKEALVDLRTRLDHAEEKRDEAQAKADAAQEKIMAILTDQRTTAPQKPAERGGVVAATVFVVALVAALAYGWAQQNGLPS